MTKKKKILIIILIIVFLIADIFAYLGYKEYRAAQTTPKEKASIEDLPDDAEISSVVGIDNEIQTDPLLSSIYEKTYLYEDEFLPGKPQTYTFYQTGIVIISFWNRYETETVKTGEERCEYSINDNGTKVTIDWDDGSSETYDFRISDDGKFIEVNGNRYEKSNLKIGDE